MRRFWSGARLANLLGYGTVVLQAGEDDALTVNWIAEIVQWIKRETALAVTLRPGRTDARGDAVVARGRRGPLSAALRDVGLGAVSQEFIRSAFQRTPDRMDLLRELKRLGYEAGGGRDGGNSGPNPLRALAEDIVTFRTLDLDMIGIGPYIPHASTPLGNGHAAAGDRRGRAGAKQRGNGVQDHCVDTYPVPGCEHSLHNCAGDNQQNTWTKERTQGRRKCGNAEPDAGALPAAVRDLSGKSMCGRERSGLQRMFARPDSHPGDALWGAARGRRGTLEPAAQSILQPELVQLQV